MNKRDQIEAAVSQMREAIANASSESLWDAVHKFDMSDSSSDPAIVRRATSKNIHAMLESHKESLCDIHRLEMIRGLIPLTPSVAGYLLKKTSGMDKLITDCMMLNTVMHHYEKKVDINDENDFIIFSSKEVFQVLHLVQQKKNGEQLTIHCLNQLLSNNEFTVSDFSSADFFALSENHNILLAMHGSSPSHTIADFIRENQEKIAQGIELREKMLGMAKKCVGGKSFFRPNKMYIDTPTLINAAQFGCDHLLGVMIKTCPILFSPDKEKKTQDDVGSIFGKDGVMSAIKNNLSDDFIRSNINNNVTIFSIAHALNVYPEAPTDKTGLNLYVSTLNRYFQGVRATTPLLESEWVIGCFEDLLSRLSDAKINSLHLDDKLPRELLNQSNRYKRCSLASDLGM